MTVRSSPTLSSITSRAPAAWACLTSISATGSMGRARWATKAASCRSNGSHRTAGCASMSTALSRQSRRIDLQSSHCTFHCKNVPHNEPLCLRCCGERPFAARRLLFFYIASSFNAVLGNSVAFIGRRIKKGQHMFNRHSGMIATLALSLIAAQPAFAASQDKYELPEPFLTMEKNYLEETPDLQKVMDVMIATEERQVKDPTQDILHNRLCAAFVYKMANDQKMPAADKRLALAGDILHNIAKEEKEDVLTNPAQLAKARDMVTRLRKAGFLKSSPNFWNDESVLTNPNIGDNRALIHNITGAVMAGDLLRPVGGYSDKEIETIEAAVVELSTGYCYYRASIDKIAGKARARERWDQIAPALIKLMGLKEGDDPIKILGVPSVFAS